MTDEQHAWRLFGQLQAMQFGRRIFNLSAARLLAQIKESKIYKRMGLTWDQFCSHVSISRAHADRQVLILRELSDELLLTVSHLGLTYRDLEKMKALPPEVRPIIENDAVIIPCEEGERRIPVQSQNLKEIQIAIDELHSKVIKEQETREKAERNSKLKVKGLERQISEMADKLELLETGDREQVPEQVAAQVEEAHSSMVRAMSAIRTIDDDVLKASPELIGKAWQICTTIESAANRLRLRLGQLMEEIDAEDPAE